MCTNMGGVATVDGHRYLQVDGGPTRGIERETAMQGSRRSRGKRLSYGGAFIGMHQIEQVSALQLMTGRSGCTGVFVRPEGHLADGAEFVDFAEQPGTQVDTVAELDANVEPRCRVRHS